MTGPYPAVDWCIKNKFDVGMCIQTEYLHLLERLLVLLPEVVVVATATSSKDVLELVIKFKNHIVLSD